MSKCYSCVYRGTVPGSAHSCCRHPEAADALDDPLSSVFAIFASVGRISGPMISEAASKLNIQANPAGISGGWFNWPWNFDPVWLKNCDGFKSKDEEL